MLNTIINSCATIYEIWLVARTHPSMKPNELPTKAMIVRMPHHSQKPLKPITGNPKSHTEQSVRRKG
jgi:hypothetical protein